MCKHRRKPHAILKPYSDISFTRSSDRHSPRTKSKLHDTVTVLLCITLCKIMTDHQNMNKTSMKDVQQHFSFKTASRVTETLLKTWFSLCLFGCFFSRVLAFKVAVDKTRNTEHSGISRNMKKSNILKKNN